MRLHHVRADHADVERREEDRERHPGQDQVVRPLHGPAAVAGWIEEVAVAGDRESGRACSRRSTRRSGRSRPGAQRSRSARRPSTVRSRSDRGRRAERIPIGSASSIQRIDAAEDERRGHRRRLGDRSSLTLCAVRERAAEDCGAITRPLQNAVLDVDRPVGAEERGDALDVVRRRRPCRAPAAPGRPG